MTRKRFSAVRKPYVPDESLIHEASTTYRVESSALVSASIAFGPLSLEGQRELISFLVRVIANYQYVAKSTKRITPSEQRARLKQIEATTRKLLRLLGIGGKKAALLRDWPGNWPRPSWPGLLAAAKQDLMGPAAMMWLAPRAGLGTVDDAFSANARLGRTSTRLENAIVELLWLYRQAAIAVGEAGERTAPGHGGRRRRRTAKGQLIQDTIDVYAAMRERYPDSGNKPGFGGPMLRFIRKVAALAGAHIRDDAEVRDVWRSWKSNRK